MKRISWCRVLDNLDLFFTLCTDSGIPDFVFQTQTICFMTYHWLPLQHYLMPVFPLLLMLPPHWPSFCVSHSADFVPQSLCHAVSSGENASSMCLQDWTLPNIHTSAPNSQKVLSWILSLIVSLVLPQIHLSWEVLEFFLFCFAFTLIKNSLLLKL